MPSGWDALETALRESGGKRLKRGNVTANLTTTRAVEKKLAPNPAALEQVLALAMALHMRIPGSQPPQAEALLALPGVLRPAAELPEERTEAATAAVRAGFDAALTALLQARQAEGERLRTTLDGLLTEIAALHRKATKEATDQPAAHRARVMENLQALGCANPLRCHEERISPRRSPCSMPPAPTCAKSFDRLASHIEAARRPADPRLRSRSAGASTSLGAGVHARGQHAVQQILLARADRHRAATESGDRAVARAGAKHRMSTLARRGLCLVLAAPSGAGKSSLTRALLATEPALSLSISVTTRPPRPAEIDGTHYHFRDQAEFDAQVAAGGFLEWARVLGRHSYGTPRAEVQAALAAGRDVAFDIDWQGHRNLRTALPGDVVGVFILPPSLAALESRLRQRAGEDPAEITRGIA